jgi:hypothetical protein
LHSDLEPPTQPMAVEVLWREGERTSTWDELWRRILREVVADSDKSPVAAPQEGLDDRTGGNGTHV